MGQSLKRAGLDQVGGQAVVLGGRPVTPVDGVGGQDPGPVLDPVEESPVGGRCAAFHHDRPSVVALARRCHTERV